MPTLAVKCPNCSKALKAPRQLIGKRVKCPKCGGRVDIVDPEAVNADEPPPAVADDDPAARSTIAETRQRETAPELPTKNPAPPPLRSRTAAEPATPLSPATAAQTAPRSRRLPGWITRPVIIASAVGLIVGYVAGREHLKYQMRSALQDAGEAFRDAFAGGPALALQMLVNFHPWVRHSLWARRPA